MADHIWGFSRMGFYGWNHEKTKNRNRPRNGFPWLGFRRKPHFWAWFFAPDLILQVPEPKNSTKTIKNLSCTKTPYLIPHIWFAKRKLTMITKPPPMHITHVFVFFQPPSTLRCLTHNFNCPVLQRRRGNGERDRAAGPSSAAVAADSGRG